MEGSNVNILEANSKSKSPSTAMEVVATAIGIDEQSGSKDGSTKVKVEASEKVIDGESNDIEAEITVQRKRRRLGKNRVDKIGRLPIIEDYMLSPIILGQKRGRGRPRGTGKLQILASLGGVALDTAGGHFTPHAVTIRTGDDIVKKILLFAQSGPRAICVLSATGPVSIVEIHPCDSLEGDILRYKGHFELLTLSGSHAFTEMGGRRCKTGMLSVSLAHADGRVFGGAVAGSLVAAGPVQLILGSFKQSIKTQLLRRRSTAMSPMDAVTPFVQRAAVEEFVATPTFPLGDSFNGAANAVGDQNVNHGSHQGFDQDVSEPLVHMSDETSSDANSGD